MTEKELSRSLLHLDAASEQTASDPKWMTHQILDRDRRRIRLLAGLAALFWTLTGAGFVCLGPFYLIIVAPRLRAYQSGHAQLAKDWNGWATAGDWVAYWLSACVVLLLLAAVCTVLLVLVSRRATLRQINASLLTISEQLKQLHHLHPAVRGG